MFYKLLDYFPGSAKLQAERESEAYQKNKEQDIKNTDEIGSWKEFPRMLWALVCDM